MTLRRDRNRGKKKYTKSRAKGVMLPNPNLCRNCWQPGPHFVPPSGGGALPGFYMCETRQL